MLNFLLLVLDDIGIEQEFQYLANGVLPGTPNMPTFASIASQGVLYQRMYAQAFCSPTRATYFTGRGAARTGIGDIIENDVEQPLFPGEYTFPKLLKDLKLGYRLGAFGKWHLGNSQDGGLLAPNIQGWDYFCGTIRNLPIVPSSPVGLQNHDAYYFFDYMVNGEQRRNNGQYSSSFIADRAITWIKEQGTNPFFAYVAFHAPHEPFHRPPTTLFNTNTWNCPDPEPMSAGLPAQSGAPTMPYFKAAIEAVDSEAGRIIASLTAAQLANTIIIILGDNGTVSTTLGNEFYPNTPPYNGAPYNAGHGKRTCYEPGIRVPMVIGGTPVLFPGRTCQGLVHTADLYMTIADLVINGMTAGTPAIGSDSTQNVGRLLKLKNLDPVKNFDSISMRSTLNSNITTSPRASMISEVFAPNGPNAGTVSGNRASVGALVDSTMYKLLRRQTTGTGPTEFYNLTADPQELTNLTPTGKPSNLTKTQLANWSALNQVMIDYFTSVAAEIGS